MDRNEIFARIWAVFEEGRTMPACAWCGRVRIDGTWLVPTSAILAAIDARHIFSHSICDGCTRAYAPPASSLARGL